MDHISIFQHFKEIFPIKSEPVDVWFQHGKHAIRVRLDDHSEYIFTYIDSGRWKIETVNYSFMDEKEMNK